MGCRDTEKVAAIVAGHEHAERALVSGLLEGRDGDAERGCEWMAELGDCPVELGVEGRELGASTGEERFEFPDSDFDVAVASLGEDIDLDVFGNGLGKLELDSLWLHADSYHQRAECRLLSNVSESQCHDSGERLPNSIELCFGVGEDPVPGRLDEMVGYGAQFAAEGLGARTARGLGPGSARFEDKGRPAEQAVGVSEGVRVVSREAGLVSLGLAELWGGRRDRG